MNGAAPEKRKKEKSLLQEALELLGCAAGIYISYLGYGILHERMYHHKYGPNGEKFEFSLFLVFCQCAVNGLCSLIVMMFVKQPVDSVPTTMYLKISASYIGAMFASNLALQYVSYPIQVLGKSCKLIPVMLMRIVVNKKRYTLEEYLMVGLITAGITVFMYQGDAKGASSSLLGLSLLGISLALDGYTGPTQENIIAIHKPSVFQVMWYMNLYAVALVSVGLVLTGELFTSLAFCQTYPDIISEIFVFSLLSALGQNFILVTLFRFNSLVLTTVTTTRKFFTILASVLWFGHNLDTQHWIGVALVFAGLGMEIMQKYHSKSKKRH